MGLQDIKAPKLIARAQSAGKAGDVAGAEALYREVLARFPANRRARDGLAQICKSRTQSQVDELLKIWQSGHAADALARTETLPHAHPTVRDIRAAALRALGEPDSAIEIYDAALTNDPKNTGLWFNAGAARLEAHRYSEAAAHLSEAVRQDPMPAYQLALVQCRLEQGFHAEAADIAESLLARPGLSIQHRVRALGFLGSTQLFLGKTKTAMETYRLALTHAPLDPEILHNVGIAANAIGDREGARKAFRTALDAAPAKAEIHRSLAGITEYTPHHPHIAEMENLLDRKLPARAESDLQFALFKARNDLSDIEAAVQHLVRANRLRRSVLRHDPAQDALLMHRLANMNPPPLTSASNDGARPIFVVGLPRSGTTLIEQILSGSPSVTAAGELPYAGQAAAELLRASAGDCPDPSHMRDFAAAIRRGLSAHAGTSPVIVDKMPLNFRWARLLLSALPDARIIWTERDIAANAFSLYRHCFAGGGNAFAYNPESIARMISLERAARDKLLCEYPDRVRIQPLSSLTEDPDTEIRALVDFCNLDWSDACLSPQSRERAVLTASQAQVRSAITPASDTELNAYAPFLTDLQQALRGEGLIP